MLVEGRKWDMPVVLAHASKFLISNAAYLFETTDGHKYVDVLKDGL